MEDGETMGIAVIVRLQGGDHVEAGIFDDEGDARRSAEQLVASFIAGGRTWPLVGDRYVRPDAVVSVDVIPDSHPRWTGSTGRAIPWTGRVE